MNTPNESPRVRRSSDRPHGTRRLGRLAAPALAAALVLAACGSDGDEDDSASNQPAAEAPVTDGSADGEAMAPLPPQENGPIAVEGLPLVPFDQSIADDSIGTAAPVVSGESFDRTPITIGGPTDSPTMVVFLAHWCPHCNDEIPELIELEESGALPDDLEIIAVSTAVADDRDNYPPSEWLDEKGWPWAAMADNEELTAISVFGGTAFPFTTILDEDGIVLGRRGGSAPADVILEFIEASLA